MLDNILGDYCTWQGPRRIVNLSSQSLNRAIQLNRPFLLTPYQPAFLIFNGFFLYM
jgi:hypothetical protein